MNGFHASAAQLRSRIMDIPRLSMRWSNFEPHPSPTFQFCSSFKSSILYAHPYLCSQTNRTSKLLIKDSSWSGGLLHPKPKDIFVVVVVVVVRVNRIGEATNASFYYSKDLFTAKVYIFLARIEAIPTSVDINLTYYTSNTSSSKNIQR